MKRIFYCLIAVAMVTPTFAADKEIEDLLASMRKAYQNTKTASFSMESTLLGENGDITVKMDGFYKNPNLISIDITFMELHAKVICDGKYIYASADKSPRTFEEKYTLEKLGDSLSGANLEILSFFDWKRQLSTDKGANMHDSKLSLRRGQKWSGKTWIVLEESAPQMGVYVEYYIDPETFLIWRTVQMSVDKEFTRGDFVVKSLKLGVKVDDSRFKKPVIAN